MIIIEQIQYLLEGFIRRSIAVIVDGTLNACNEIFKFAIVLVIVYYFGIWSFQFLNDVLQGDHDQNDLSTKTDIKDQQVVGETYLRIGPPHENLIKNRASLLEQLEIEAEFEEYQDKLIKSEADLEEQFLKKEIPKAPLKTRDSDEIVPFTHQFVSQMKQELNETSRASQTLKTSLGKKSKLRDNSENRPSTWNETNNYHIEEANKVPDVKKEILSDWDDDSAKNDSRATKTKRLSKTKEERPSFDDQYDHESFHRV
ncbi:hypothetical protein FF38_02156 [Lucilia cuprina]|uniref:Uncharacterized protein n=1 Tax=Lucilia cuprina TaxID=7375 RepID=A0A0L0BZF2_LUCCU|nr:hypothetical protein CVS40_8882 [Lucilia cuprina]KNC25462.1 hypothetical protein FF38_02156 [Lucilia cuprina]